MVMVRIPMQAAMRAASVQLLRDYAQAANLSLNVLKARPTARPSIPMAFVDTIRETLDYESNLRQRTPFAEVVVLHGLFDSEGAADAKDDFADGFLDWVTDRYHAAGANTLISVVETQDEPSYVTDWLRPDIQASYYATRITLEGYAEG